ncbi:charged multivesicular body protein 7-like [Anneissia japonica]|uniref:charged multivesicular body protein 7-like n=1 Tax=Anneissia japonica TaxID=1529436 RepID=UPI001425756D|nr:charged multivesicular body protein 7-like [Anneissia japonica]
MKNYFPKCWEDDERMDYLFSAFRGEKNTNPHDWDTKINFWNSVITAYCRSHKTVTVNCETIIEEFRRKGKVPLCVGQVLDELIRIKKLESVNYVIASRGWLSWSFHVFISTPSSWLFSRFWKKPTAYPSGVYIHRDLLKEYANSLLEAHHNQVQCDLADNLVTYEAVKSLSSDFCKDSTTLDLILSYLEKEKKICIGYSGDGSKVVKFTDGPNSTVQAISEADFGIIRLKKTIEMLKLQISKLVEKKKKLHQEAKTALKEASKTKAKQALRKKLSTEKMIENSEQTLATLEQLQDEIKTAESQKVILSAYEAGASALRKTLSDQRLRPDIVHNTMSDVQEVVEMCQDISTIMQDKSQELEQSYMGEESLDQSDLEAELAALLNSQADSDNEEYATSSATPVRDKGDTPLRRRPIASANKFDVDSLPDVPSHNIQEDGDKQVRQLLSS